DRERQRVHLRAAASNILRRAKANSPPEDTRRMNYHTYQAWADLTAPVRAAFGLTAALLRPPCVAPIARPWLGALAAAGEMLGRAGLRHERLAYAVDRVSIGGSDVAVSEEVADRTPFGTLLRFRKDLAGDQPRVLLVAPMSGHFATLLRGTVRAMLP